MRGLTDTAFIFLGLVAVLICLVLVAIFAPGGDAEITKALSYGVVGLVGALGGASRKRDSGTDNP